MKKKVARVRKISKERSELKKEIKKTQRSLAAPDVNPQFAEILENNLLQMTLMKQKKGVDLLAEFVSKPIAEAISPRTMNAIEQYNQRAAILRDRVREQPKEKTTEESSKKRSGSNSSKQTTPEKVKRTEPLEPVKPKRRPIKKTVKKANYDNTVTMA